MEDKMINFLLENANPSIKYRIKKEFLNNITPAEERWYGLWVKFKNPFMA